MLFFVARRLCADLTLTDTPDLPLASHGVVGRCRFVASSKYMLLRDEAHQQITLPKHLSTLGVRGHSSPVPHKHSWQPMKRTTSLCLNPGRIWGNPRLTSCCAIQSRAMSNAKLIKPNGSRKCTFCMLISNCRLGCCMAASRHHRTKTSTRPAPIPNLAQKPSLQQQRRES